MRTIKFRGKRIDGKGWVYGGLITNQSNQCFIALWDSVYLIKGKTDAVSNRIIPVIPESVGQWTGLVDRHGKEIYEGDILRATPNGEEHIGVVEYDVGEAQWFGAKDFLGYAVAYSGAEIIGNIHDKICDYKNTGCGNCEVPNELRRCNPELMEVE